MLKPGSNFTVPATATAPMLKTGKPEALRIMVGNAVAPPVGPPGTTVKDVSLLPADLMRAGGPVAAPPPAAATAQPAPPPLQQQPPPRRRAATRRAGRRRRRGSSASGCSRNRAAAARQYQRLSQGFIGGQGASAQTRIPAPEWGIFK